MQVFTTAITLLLLREGRVRELARDAKEDEIIRAIPEAHDDLIAVESKSEAEIKKLREAVEDAEDAVEEAEEAVEEAVEDTKK